MGEWKYAGTDGGGFLSQGGFPEENKGGSIPVTGGRKSGWIVWLLALPVVWWAAVLIADSACGVRNFMEILETATEKLDHPFDLHWNQYTLKSILACTILYGMGIGIFYANKRNYRRGEEHGSARWGDAFRLCKKYRDNPYSENLLLTQNLRIGLNCYRHRRNLNVLVVGGSGAGKSRGYALPNIMQCDVVK